MTASIDQAAFVWDLSGSGAIPLTPTFRLDHNGWVRDAKFDATGKLLATASDDYLVRVYDLSGATAAADTGEGDAAAHVSEHDQEHDLLPTRTFSGHTDYVHSVAFSHDSKRLVSGGDDKHLIIWDLDPGVDEVSPRAPLDNMKSDLVESPIRGVVFSADGSKVLSASRDEGIAIWSPGAPNGQQCRLVEVAGLDSAAFRSMRIDPEYPNVLFTESGAYYIDFADPKMEKEGEKDEPEAKEAKEETTDAAEEATGATEEAARHAPLSSTSAGKLPPGWPLISVRNGAITWGGRDLIHIPEGFRPTGEPDSWRVQGRMLVIGTVSGQVLLFRFAENANPLPP